MAYPKVFHECPHTQKIYMELSHKLDVIIIYAIRHFQHQFGFKNPSNISHGKEDHWADFW